MTKEFKPGFYHLRNGNRAEIFKIEDGFIWGRRMVFGQWQPCYWELDGKDDDQRGDLIAPWPTEPEEIEGFLNVYKNGFMSHSIHSGNFTTKEIADYDGTSIRIDCRRITYAKGKRLSYEECLEIAIKEGEKCNSNSNFYTVSLVICKSYITNYRIGRVWDSSEKV